MEALSFMTNKQKFYYSLSLFLCPVLILLIHYLISKNKESPLFLKTVKIIQNPIFGRMAGLLLIAFLYYINRRDYFQYFIYNPFLNFKSGPFFLITGALIYLSVIKKSRNPYILFLLYGLCAIALVGFSLVHIGDLHSGLAYHYTNIENSPWGWVDFNAVFYGFTQTLFGKIALVDFLSQYGNFTFFIKPLLFFFPFNLFSFSLLMALLGVSSFLLTYLALRIWIKDISLCLLVLLAMLYCIFFFHPVVYLANLPIRFFFPAITFFAFSIHLNKASRGSFPIMTVLLAASSILWNSDTGTVLFIAVWLTLCFQLILQNGLRVSLTKNLLWGGYFLLSLFACFFFYFLVAYIARGISPDFSEMSHFYKFYVAGIGTSIKLPDLHPWNLVFLTYQLGISYSLGKFFNEKKEEGSLPSIVLFLSLYGMGIFSYYIVRSHDRCLFAVCYPAVLLTGLFLHLLLSQQEKPKFLGLAKIMTACLVILALCSFSPHKTSIQFALYKNKTIDKTVEERLEFLKTLRLHSSEMIFISDYSGVLHLASKTYCPIKIPSATEMLQADVETLEKYLLAPSPSKKAVVLDKLFFMYRFPIWGPIHRLLESRKPYSTNSDGTLLFYLL
jgi:hypothetical protein